MISAARLSGAGLLVVLLVCSLLSTASAITYNYTTFFTPPVGCSLATDTTGNVYVGLCDQQTILKLAVSGGQLSAATSYNSAVQQTLAPYSSNKNNILQFEYLCINSLGTLYFLDLYNLRILGVDSSTGTQISTIDMSSYNGALSIGAVNTQPNIWASVPGASSGTATVVQLSPSGQQVSIVSATSDPTNLANYFVFGVQPDYTNTYVYLGGCVIAVAGSILYLPGQGFEYATAPNQLTPCDIRKVSVASSVVQLPTFSVSPASLNFTGNTQFFSYISIAPPSSTNFAGSIIGADPDYTGYSFLWNSSSGGNSVRNFSGSTNSPAFTSTGTILNLQAGGTQIGQYTGGGVQPALYNITSVSFGHPFFVAIGPGGSPVYVNSQTSSTVAVFNTQGTITGYIGAGTLVGPWAMATDASGNLYVVDGATNIPYKFSSSGQLLVTYNSGSLNPYIGGGICVDPNNGNVIVPADNSTGPGGSGYVMIFSNAGTLINVVANSITYPWACAVTSASDIIVDSANEPGSIWFLRANQSYQNPTTVTYPPLGTTWETLGMAQSSDGRIFVAALNLGIYIFSSTGQYIDVLSSPQEDIYTYSMAYSSGNGQLYVVDLFNDRVVTFQVSSNPTKNAAARSAGLVSAAAMAGAALLLTLLIFV